MLPIEAMTGNVRQSLLIENIKPTGSKNSQGELKD